MTQDHELSYLHVLAQMNIGVNDIHRRHKVSILVRELPMSACKEGIPFRLFQRPHSWRTAQVAALKCDLASRDGEASMPASGRFLSRTAPD
jgi:hypothetical protein